MLGLLFPLLSSVFAKLNVLLVVSLMVALLRKIQGITKFRRIQSGALISRPTEELTSVVIVMAKNMRPRPPQKKDLMGKLIVSCSSPLSYGQKYMWL